MTDGPLDSPARMLGPVAFGKDEGGDTVTLVCDRDGRVRLPVEIERTLREFDRMLREIHERFYGAPAPAPAPVAVAGEHPLVLIENALRSDPRGDGDEDQLVRAFRELREWRLQAVRHLMDYRHLLVREACMRAGQDAEEVETTRLAELDELIDGKR